MSWWEDFTSWFGTDEDIYDPRGTYQKNQFISAYGTNDPMGKNWDHQYYKDPNGGYQSVYDAPFDVGNSQYELKNEQPTYAPAPQQMGQVMQGMNQNKGSGGKMGMMGGGVKNWGDEMAMSALEHYKDMSNWANPGTLIGLLNASGNVAKTQDPYEEFMKVKGLLGGW